MCLWLQGGDSPTKSETVSEIESPPFLQQSHVQLFCIKQAVPVLEGSIISTAAVKGGSLSAGLQSSPDRSSTMDLTECSLSALECYTPAAISRYSSTSFQFIAPDDGLAWSPAQVGGETSELPSLADLADEDNLIARREGHGCVPPDGKSLSGELVVLTTPLIT